MNEEDQIIQEGLKSKSKQDTLCYIGMAVLAVLIILPPVFRIVFKEEKKETIEEVVYLTLTCRYRFYVSEESKELVEQTITYNYRNSDALDMKVEFKPDNNDTDITGAERIKEFTDLFDKVKGKAKVTQTKNSVSLFLDLLEHPEVRDVGDLKPYLKPAVAEMDYLRNQKSMNCSKESNIVKEDTTKWENEHKKA